MAPTSSQPQYKVLYRNYQKSMYGIRVMLMVHATATTINMPPGTKLSDEKRGKVLAYRDENRTVRFIAEKHKTSKTAVLNIITANKTGSNSGKRGIKSKVLLQTECRIKMVLN